MQRYFAKHIILLIEHITLSRCFNSAFLFLLHPDQINTFCIIVKEEIFVRGYVYFLAFEILVNKKFNQLIFLFQELYKNFFGNSFFGEVSPDICKKKKQPPEVFYKKRCS